MANKSGSTAMRNRIPATSDKSEGLTRAVGNNLHKFRGERGLSLEKLATLSGVSRSMLGQIELGQSAPTINVVWKIAQALELPFSALIADLSRRQTRVLKASDSKHLHSSSGQFFSRPLFPADASRKVEFYQLKLQAGASEEAEPHAPGTLENLVVSQGRLNLTLADEQFALEVDDAILFEADVPHSYHNPDGEDAIYYLVMTYP